MYFLDTYISETVLHEQIYMLEILIPAFVLIIWTASNTLIKSLTGKMESDNIALIVIGAGIVPMAFSIFMTPHLNIAQTTLFLGVTSGIFLSLGYILFYKSLKGENLGSAGVTINMQQIIVISFSLLILKETVSSLILPAVILIIIGSMLVTIKSGFKINRYLMLAALANIIWGIYYMPLSFAILSLHSSVMPLLIARTSGFIMTFIAFEALFMYRRMKARHFNMEKKANYTAKLSFTLMLAVVAGILDGSGNVFYALSISQGFLVMAGALVAMLPATLALSGKFLFKEKLSSKQYIGVLLSVAGALLIAI